ncbi:M14 family metallopeptidase [Paenibacillus filicis]|uniref:M14 family metallopeptidase n=1 Tax=Paenibacillus gyeongsangnamensis TaxID=3388067 RepID=A0ABT4Q570_9BACL|nr:M14 family metallopeptidase [Paenibacillus filicis]MCZ8512022.1 M14 family metallopeptidase [Paenibacillus filicis]
MTFTYMVQPGDTLHRIARRYGMNVKAIYSANPQLQEPGYVYPGQQIFLPVLPVNRYFIQAGDTFAELARRFNIDPMDLQAANPEADPRRLRIGQPVVLPISRGLSIGSPLRPYGYEELQEDLASLGRTYPFLETDSIGESVQGRVIPVVRLGTGVREVHYNASFHANEWITSLLLMKFLEELAGTFASGGEMRERPVRPLLEACSLWIVPMVNPDGVELVQQGISPAHPLYASLLEWNHGSFDFSSWKANARGVDLNDQFPAGWELERARRAVKGPGPRDYGGTHPLSEPESAAMAAFTRSRDFRLVMALHTQGREVYWNYRGFEPEESEIIAGQLAKVSGYRAVELTDSDAGYKDWFIETFRRPGFTIEAGFGVNPLPLDQFRSMYEDVSVLLLEGLQAACT